MDNEFVRFDSAKAEQALEDLLNKSDHHTHDELEETDSSEDERIDLDSADMKRPQRRLFLENDSSPERSRGDAVFPVDNPDLPLSSDPFSEPGKAKRKGLREEDSSVSSMSEEARNPYLGKPRDTLTLPPFDRLNSSKSVETNMTRLSIDTTQTPQASNKKSHSYLDRQDSGSKSDGPLRRSGSGSPRNKGKADMSRSRSSKASRSSRTLRSEGSSRVSRGTHGSPKDTLELTLDSPGSVSIPRCARRVLFSTIEIRYYRRILGDNPSVTNGVSIGIGWDYDEIGVCPVDKYEAAKEGLEPLKGTELIMSREEREELAYELGYTKAQITEAVRQVVKMKNRRKQTSNNLMAAPLEEQIESVRKKFFNFGRRNSKANNAHLKAFMPESALPLSKKNRKKGFNETNPGGSNRLLISRNGSDSSDVSGHGGTKNLVSSMHNGEKSRRPSQIRLTPEQSAALIAKYLEESGHDKETASTTADAFATYLNDRASSDGGSQVGSEDFPDYEEDDDDWSEAFDDVDDIDNASVSSKHSLWSVGSKLSAKKLINAASDLDNLVISNQETGDKKKGITPNKSSALFRRFIKNWDPYNQDFRNSTASGFSVYVKDECNGGEETFTEEAWAGFSK